MGDGRGGIDDVRRRVVDPLDVKRVVGGKVIAGEGDKLFKSEMQRNMAGLLPDAVLTLIPNAGHMPMVEQPVAVNEALLALVQRVQAKQ